MRRIGAVSAAVVGLACGGPALGDDDGPPLAPPATGPTASVSAPAASAAAPALPPAVELVPPPSGGNGAVLALPGLRGPARIQAGMALPPLEPVGTGETSELPPVMSPPVGTTAPTSTGPTFFPGPAATRGPSTLESVPGGDPPARVPSSSLSGRREFFRGTAPAPRRASGLFGRFFAPPPMLGRSAADTDDSISVEPRSDPAAEAALKRRIEYQIRQALGDRVQSVEVRVVGRDVNVRTHASRFWQRRAVRRTIETMPALSGLKANVTVE